MKVTQDQARHMRCCGPEGCGEYTATAVNGAKRRYCIGSKCMAWQWVYPQAPKDEATRLGQCGLARQNSKLGAQP